MGYEGLIGETITVRSHDGDRIEAPDTGSSPRTDRTTVLSRPSTAGRKSLPSSSST
jgi:hypothetical protein